MYLNKKYKKGKRAVEALASPIVKVAKLANKALDVAVMVKALVNVEYKSFTIALVTDPNSTGVVTHLTAIAQGSDFSNRIGRKIKLLSLSIRGNIAINGSATNSIYRLLILRDNSGTTTPPTIANLFTDTATFLNNKNKIGDPQSNSRFTVLSDTWYTINIGNENTRKKIQIYKKVNFHVNYSGTAATDEGKGCVYALQASSEASLDPIVTADVMIKYIDN